MNKAIKLADYFYKSALDVYERAMISMKTPMEVIIAANMMKMNKSLYDIAEILMAGDISREPFTNNEKEQRKIRDKYKQKMSRLIKKWIKQYPWAFGATKR